MPKAEPPPELHSILLPCPRCGDCTAAIELNLGNLDEPDDGCMNCRECDGVFTLTEVRAIIREWAPIVAWIDALPGYLAKEE